MTTARHQYVDPLASSKKHKPKYASSLNKRERITFRILIAAVAVFAVIVTITDVYLANLGHKTQNTVKQGRKDRLNFQHSIQVEANQEKKDLQALACYAANAVPRGKSPFLDGLAKKYDCPPYRKPAVTPKTGVNPGSTQNSSSNTSTEPSSSPSSSPIAQKSAELISSSPPQSRKSSSSSTRSVPTPTQSDLLGPICKQLHLNC